KFMLPPTLEFLMAYSHLSGDKPAREHLERTLDHMALGGVFDQIGGGFFRYSTDPRWHIPHFEKMLYDNAQLLGIFSKAYAAFSRKEYRKVVERIFTFLKRDMRAPGGGYYAALDADTEGEEGKFYRWQAGELESLLGADYPLFAAYYGIQPELAWENGHYVPFRQGPDSDFIKEHDLSPAALEGLREKWHALLMKSRSARPFPGRDDKIITSWNALLISGLADAYEAFGDTTYLREARDLYAFVLGHSEDGGRLRHSYKEGDTRSRGFLEDYAFMARAAFRMYQVTGETKFLDQAETWMGTVERQFKDPESPLFRYKEDSELIAPIVKTDDGVMPSPNTVLAELFLDLGHFYYRPEYLEKGKEMVLALQDRFLQAPENYAGWGRLLLRYHYPFYEVAIAGEDAAALRAEMAREYLPETLLVFTSERSELPLFEARFEAGPSRIFVCQDHSCRLPVTSVSQALRQIRGAPVLFP
ncbi:MAG: AGE family epimerase/isomerase, partial [Robiginitalea sp.]